MISQSNENLQPCKLAYEHSQGITVLKRLPMGNIWMLTDNRILEFSFNFCLLIYL